MYKSLSDEIINQFTSSVSALDVILSVSIAFVISVYIIYIYKKTFSGVVYNKNISLTIIMLSLVTSLIIRTINANLSLSLGMVGALSIVRFRTAIKEPLDTGFMFWAITAGIMSGAGLYAIALLGSLILGLLFYLAYSLNVKAKNQYLLVINYRENREDEVNEKLDEIKNKRLKNKTINSNEVEVTYEVVLDDIGFINKIKKINGVNSVNLISYKNDIGV